MLGGRDEAVLGSAEHPEGVGEGRARHRGRVLLRDEIGNNGGGGGAALAGAVEDSDPETRGPEGAGRRTGGECTVERGVHCRMAWVPCRSEEGEGDEARLGRAGWRAVGVAGPAGRCRAVGPLCLC